MSKKTRVTLFLSIIIIGYTFGGTTGKISGIITDAETGEGVVGANIQIEGTALGAATDADGVYVILNVPPGLYTLSISYIGYQAVLVKDVRVNVDFTTRLDQSLEPTVIEGTVVEVYGERNPLVRQDLTNTQVAVTAEQIDELPVDQIRDIIALQAGVIEDNDGALHIRGGRSNEIAYQVNGISINNPFGNSQGVGLATNAVEEVSVSAGTFSAEYGNALSGVINYVTKDGADDYHASLKAYSGDHFSSRNDIFFNIGEETDVLNNARIEGTLSGPVPLFGNQLTFFASGVYLKDNGHLYGIRLYKPEDLLFVTQETFSVDPFGYSFDVDSNGRYFATFDSARAGASGDRKIVPMVTREDLNLTGKLSWKPHHNIKLTYDLIFDDGERFPRIANGINVFRRYRFTPDGRPKTISRNLSQSFGITHTLSKTTFYTLKLGINYNKARTLVFEDANDPRYIPLTNNDITSLIIPQTDIIVGGTDLERTFEDSRTLLAKLDIVSQVHPKHELKLGGELALHRLDLESYVLFFDINQLRYVVPSPDVIPNSINYQSYRRKPVQAAFYVLDKMELADRFILNAGLRYEFLDTEALYNPDVAASVDDPEGVGSPKFLREATPKHRLSPRLSLSFPITSRGIIRFSYGFFYQNPTFRNIYRNPRFTGFVGGQAPTGTPEYGNPNLKPQRSIQYEMGLQQQFTDDIKIDLTIFYKDVNDLIERRRVIAGDVASSKQFNIITNVSYANVRGFTVAFLKRRSTSGLFSATLDYTLQIGEGAFDDPVDLAVNSRTGRQTEQKLVPLDFNRSHTLNGTITLAKPDNWIASLIASAQSGTPYTPSLPTTLQDVDFEINSEIRPLLTNVDLKLEKFFRFQKNRFSIFIQVQNLFDTKQQKFVFLSTGRSLNSLEEVTNPSRFNQVREAILTDPQNFFPIEFIDNYYQREDFLGAPREVRGGLTFEF